MEILAAILDIGLDAAPWLLFGLVLAGLIRAFIPTEHLQRWIGGHGLAAVSRAAVIGAPLPLCSCGAIPTAVTLHRGGAGRGPTTAFLIGTPGVGADSLAISYALLGPVMMVARAVGAVAVAITTGTLVGMMPERHPPAGRTPEGETDGCERDTCCGTHAHGDRPSAAGRITTRLGAGMRYAFSEVLDDIAPWLAVGLILAGVLMGLTDPQSLAALGSGLVPMVFMALIGLPLYICATAATPVAAGLLLAGVSPGTVLVFLIAGPVTSLATLGVIRRELGTAPLAVYLVSIVLGAIVIGLLVDQIINAIGINIIAQTGAAGALLPLWLKAASLAALVVLALPPLRRRVGDAFAS